MKKFLAYTFLFIFSFQVLPVKELGRILFKGLMTEEVHENCLEADDAPGSKVKKEPDLDKLLYAYQLTREEMRINAKVHTAIHNSDTIPAYHVPDIATPPPNC